tara:strand:- start:1196 stop:1396 length:201 start_codon:yes stop_codon:yes gene_type:complete
MGIILLFVSFHINCLFSLRERIKSVKKENIFLIKMLAVIISIRKVKIEKSENCTTFLILNWETDNK